MLARGAPTVCAALALVASPAAAAARPAATDSGVAGLVRSGCAFGRDVRSCRTAAPRVEFEIRRSSDGRRVASALVRDGRFRVALAPGRYLVRVAAVDGDARVVPARAAVRVRAGAFTLLVFRLEPRRR